MYDVAVDDISLDDIDVQGCNYIDKKTSRAVGTINRLFVSASAKQDEHRHVPHHQIQRSPVKTKLGIPCRIIILGVATPSGEHSRFGSTSLGTILTSIYIYVQGSPLGLGE